MTTEYYAACDLGAESGRVILGSLTEDKISIEEIHRFPNVPVELEGGLHWDTDGIFEELKKGLRKLAERGLPIRSISADSWGVDFVRLDAEGRALAQPYHYRDTRTAGEMERVFQKVGAEEVFAETGIQFMLINTLYQLHHDHRKGLLKSAGGFLNIGDYFNFRFSGMARAEASLASTSQIYNPKTRAWSRRLIEGLGVPASLFPEVVPAGTRLGRLCVELEEELGLKGTEVVATCSHDTGAAVAAAPGAGDKWAYLSSGTWSLLGIEAEQPVITAKSRELNYTNEVGYGGTIRLLKNIIGLWVVQECRRSWSQSGKEYSYEELTRLAENAEPLRSVLNLRSSHFEKPGDMPGKIADYCRRSGQAAPMEPGQFVRCALESLALLYRRTVEELEEIAGSKIERLHIVGGGSKNLLLNQWSANALQRTVIAGPVEATAIGNVLVQAMAFGRLGSLADVRDIVRNSFELKTYLPQEAELWNAAYEQFRDLPENL